jgi:hypothetical protein
VTEPRSLTPPRAIHDRHDFVLGTSRGTSLDPWSSEVGLTIELAPTARRKLDTWQSKLWVPESQVAAIRKDRITLDVSVDELARARARGAQARSG